MSEQNTIFNHSFDSDNNDEMTLPHLSDQQAFIAVRRAFTELEAQGISDFQIFNALADLCHERGEGEMSQLLADAAYYCFRSGKI